MAIKLDNEALIKEVEKRSVIWDRNYFGYNNKGLSSRLWAEISDEMNVPVETLKKRWRNLRDQFRMQFKKILSLKNETGDSKFQSSWHYYNMLLFLENQVGFNRNSKSRRKKPKVNVKYRHTSVNLEASTNFVKGQFLDEELANINEDPFIATNDQSQEFYQEHEEILEPPFKRNFQRLEIKNKNSLEKDVRLIETTRDEDEAFFQSLIPHMEKMEPEQKLLCRIEIQKIVYQHAYKKGQKLI